MRKMVLAFFNPLLFPIPCCDPINWFSKNSRRRTSRMPYVCKEAMKHDQKSHMLASTHTSRSNELRSRRAHWLEFHTTRPRSQDTHNLYTGTLSDSYFYYWPAACRMFGRISLLKKCHGQPPLKKRQPVAKFYEQRIALS